MLVFIDDSGDPGFKFDKGSTLFFIISAVIFNDDLEAEKTAIAIKQLRRDLGFSDNMEFKFNKSSKKVRIAFLEAANSYKFKIRSLVVEKKIIRSEELKNKNPFYSYAIKMLLKYSSGSILDASIKIDGSGDRIFRRAFLGYLKRQLNSKQKTIMKKCRLENSKNNVLIQLADMIAGSIHRSYQVNKTDRNIYKAIIKKHIEDEWKFK